MDVSDEMQRIADDDNPNELEKKKYLRYLISQGSMAKKRPELEKRWGQRQVSELIEEIESENKKPNPRKYYVSLKEPLDENF